MNRTIDAYAHLDSPLHRWDPRYKLPSLLLLMFAFASITSLWLLPVIGGMTVALYALSRLPFSFLRDRLRYPGLFLLAVVLILPLVSGETIVLQLGVLAVRREGIVAALLVLGRFSCIITLSVVLFGTAPLLETIRALRSLGLPASITDMMLFFSRYLHDIAANFSRLQTALRLRGFQGRRLNRRTLSTLASLTGTLLIRSYEQSERVYLAMRLRGYGTPVHSPPPGRATRSDTLALVGIVLMAGGLLLAEIVGAP